MSALPLPPAEVPAEHTVTGLAPKFLAALQAVLTDLVGKGWRPILRETTRSDARAAFLYGFGREYDDGRGIVTNAPNALKTWHHFGLSADVGDRRYEAGSEPPEFYTALRECAEAHGLTVGSDWNRNGIPDAKEPGKHFCDADHVQWWCEGMHVAPSDHAAELLASGGVEAVWQAVHAA